MIRTTSTGLVSPSLESLEALAGGRPQTPMVPPDGVVGVADVGNGSQGEVFHTDGSAVHLHRCRRLLARAPGGPRYQPRTVEDELHPGGGPHAGVGTPRPQRPTGACLHLGDPSRDPRARPGVVSANPSHGRAARPAMRWASWKTWSSSPSAVLSRSNVWAVIRTPEWQTV